MRTVHRIKQALTPVVQKSGSTSGAMRAYHGAFKGEVIDFASVQGVGRFNTPIPSTRRI